MPRSFSPTASRQLRPTAQPRRRRLPPRLLHLVATGGLAAALLPSAAGASSSLSTAAAVAAAAVAATPAAADGQVAVAPPSGPVADRAHVLSPAAAAQLERLLRAHEAETGGQFVVLTLPTLGEEPLESAAVRVFESWRIGQTKYDNGLLLLLVIDRRQVRIEVGYGLEGTLTDVFTRHVIQEIMVPQLQRGDYDAAVGRAVQALIGRAGREAVGQPRGPAHATSRLFPYAILCVLFLLVVMRNAVVRHQLRSPTQTGRGLTAKTAEWVWDLCSALLAAFFRGGGGRGGRGGWSGGGGGGGGWSGGGGSSGGGGASGGW